MVGGRHASAAGAENGYQYYLIDIDADGVEKADGDCVFGLVPGTGRARGPGRG
jgi:hypothetical protein